MKKSINAAIYVKGMALYAVAIAALILLVSSSQQNIEMPGGGYYNVNGPQLYVKALPNAGQMDRSFSIRLELDGVNDLYGYSVDMVYDPSVIAVRGIKPLGAFNGRKVIRPVERVDNDKGVLSFVEMLLGPVEGQSAHLLLAELQVEFYGQKAMRIKAVYDKKQLDSAAKDLILLVRLVDSRANPITYNSIAAYIDEAD